MAIPRGAPILALASAVTLVLGCSRSSLFDLPIAADLSPMDGAAPDSSVRYDGSARDPDARNAPAPDAFLGPPVEPLDAARTPPDGAGVTDALGPPGLGDGGMLVCRQKSDCSGQDYCCATFSMGMPMGMGGGASVACTAASACSEQGTSILCASDADCPGDRSRCCAGMGGGGRGGMGAGGMRTCRTGC
jgi:hypothetical protein